MSLDLANYEAAGARSRQIVLGQPRSRARQTNRIRQSGCRARGAVTAGKNMDGFLAIAQTLIEANGLGSADICVQQRVLTLPGFFRPTKLWDMLVINRGQLIAALEFKSQVGPSFGNNFNNRSEEAIGTAHDLWTAYREGAFGEDAPRPFLGWVMLLEDCDKSNSPVTDKEPHFPVDPSLQGRILRAALRSSLQASCSGRTLFQRHVSGIAAR